ncbi:MAG: VOC family protein [Candidatus Pacearchaeota archaeon]
MKKVQKIVSCLWFDNQAEAAVDHYVSIFENSKILKTERYGEEGSKIAGTVKGSVMTILFELNGEQFLALNGGPIFKFTEAVSFIVNCDSQEEIDYFWEKLSEGGEEGVCGWLKDKFGLSWQVVPTALDELTSDEDPERTERVMKSLYQMKKINIDELKRASKES